MGVIYGPDGRVISSVNAPLFEAPGEPANNNWLKWATRYVEGVHNPDKISIADYERMDQTDEKVFSGGELLIQLILSRLGDYTHPVPEIQDFIRQNFEQMEGNFIQACREILTAIKFGYSVTEILWRRGLDGRDWLRGLQTLHPDTLVLDMHRSGPMKNKLSCVYQWWHQGEEEQKLEVGKVIHYAHGCYFGQLYGVSRYKRAYKNWLIKDVLLRVYCTTLERYGCPLGLAKVPNLNMKVRLPDKLGGGECSISDYMTKVMDALAASGSLVAPLGVELELLQAKTALGRDILDAIIYLNQAIHTAIGVPVLVSDVPQVGSHSLGVQQNKTFNMLMESILVELTETLLEQLVRRILEANYPVQAYKANLGMFQTEEFDPELALKFAEIAEKLQRTGIVDMDNLDDVNHFRAQQGLPLWTEEELRANYPEVDEEEMLPGEGGEDSEKEDEPAENPDRHGVSFAARRRNQLRAKTEMYRRISREGRKRRAAA